MPVLYRTEHGVVRHPADWEWVGYHEIMGSRRRYRVVDMDRLCWRLRSASLDEVRKNLAASLAERIARADVKREPCWTESLAVGSRGFVEKIQPMILSRRETEVVAGADNVWTLQEAAMPYGQETSLKNTSKAAN
jgi:putative transposase